jgi:Tfp pilus assembly protein PilO
MKIPTRHLALIGLLVAVPVSAWSIAYRPMNSAVHDVAEEIRMRTTALSHFDEINTQYRELKSLSKTLRKSMIQAENRIPLQHGADQWLESASDAALELGLLIRSVTTSGERIDGQYNILPVDLTVSGSFESVYGLIQHLEQMNRMTRVDRMTIHRLNEDEVEARIVIHLIFSAERDSA